MTTPQATPPAAQGPGTGGGDPSMEDILASIRRILSEDDVPAGATATPPGSVPGIADDVLPLDESMLAEEPAATARPPIMGLAPSGVPLEAPPRPVIAALEPQPPPFVSPVPPPNVPAPPPVATPVSGGPAPPPPPPRATAAPPPPEPLVAPATAAAAASSLGSLVRTLATERHAPVYRGGPTIEDIVREEVRPLLKQWLDAHLPGTVERLVRQEIARVTGESTS